MNAQSFDLDGAHAAPAAEDGIALSGAQVGDTGEFGLVVHLGYSNDALMAQRPRGDQLQEVAVVRHQASAQMFASAGLFGHGLVFLGLDLPFVLAGDTVPADFAIPSARGGGLGDLTLGARGLLWSPQGLPLRLGVQALATLPLARWVDGEQAYRGERAATLKPTLMAEVPLPGVRIMLNVGALLRRDVQVGRSVLRDAWTYGLGAMAPLLRGLLDLHVEGHGETDLARPGREGSSSFEALLGLSLHGLLPLRLSFAGGPGLSRGVGTPDMRLLVRVTHSAKALPPPLPPPPAPDADRDGIADADDACPYDAEDRDGVVDGDGCPDYDNDVDGIADDQDRCPGQAEDWDGYDDADGCPEADNDGDGIEDGYDRCPWAAEDLDGVEDADGCPEGVAPPVGAEPGPASGETSPAGGA